MGQKVNPHGARVGVIKDWNTRWYADKKNFADNLVSDAKLRKMIKELEFVDDKSKKPVKLYDAGISSIEIERRFDNEKARVTVTLNVAKPGIVIGANGANIEKIKAAIVKELGAQNAQVILNVQEIKNPDLDAQLVAENIAAQLENRVPFAPARIELCRHFFIARRKDTRFSSCAAMFSATSCASKSGFLISCTLRIT